MSLAIVGRIVDIMPHPNADRVEVITIRYNDDCAGCDVRLVTGKHYRVGDPGVWLRPGAVIPGWLAYQLWMVGKKRAEENFVVRDMPIRGVPSPGLWVGQWYRNDSSKESVLRAEELERGGGRVVDGWIEWVRWNPAWRPGDDVTEELGVDGVQTVAV